MNRIYFDCQFEKSFMIHWQDTDLPATELLNLSNEVYRRAKLGETVNQVVASLAAYYKKTGKLKIERKK